MSIFIIVIHYKPNYITFHKTDLRSSCIRQYNKNALNVIINTKINKVFITYPENRFYPFRKGYLILSVKRRRYNKFS